MTNNEKIEIITTIAKAYKNGNVNECNQNAIGVMTKLSYGASINNFTSDELNEALNEVKRNEFAKEINKQILGQMRGY